MFVFLLFTSLVLLLVTTTTEAKSLSPTPPESIVSVTNPAAFLTAADSDNCQSIEENPDNALPDSAAAARARATLSPQSVHIAAAERKEQTSIPHDTVPNPNQSSLHSLEPLTQGFWQRFFLRSPNSAVVDDDANDATSRQKRQTSLFMCLLAASAGFGDVRSNRLYGCFVNMCTGNTIRVVTALVEHYRAGGAHNYGNHQHRAATATAATATATSNVATPAAVVISYVTGVALARTTKHIVEHHYQQVQQLHQQQQEYHQSCIAFTPINESALATQDPVLLRLMRRCLLIPSSSPSPSKLTSSVCVAITPLVLFFFAMADVWTMQATPSKTNNNLWRAAAAQAVAYGLMHTAATEATGGWPLFVVTGHWTGLSRSSVDFVWNAQTPSADPATLTTLVMHVKIIVSFVAGICGSVVLLDRIVPLLWPAVIRGARHCPAHTFTGLFYATLFFWYGTNNSQ